MGLLRDRERDSESGHVDGGREKLSGNTYDPAFQRHDAELDEPSVHSERKLITKIDLRLIPVLSVLYLLAFLDRTNIGNAAVYGLSADLGIPRTSTEFNNALVLFFPLYILFEVPSNILLKRFKPHVWLSICVFLFGLITICQGFVSSVGGLYAARIFLGLAETGMFPGCFYLIGMWYKRSEAQARFSFFFASTSLAGAFGGLLAAALANLDGKGGYRAWRWVFIIEGLITCVVSFLFFFVIPDFPENAKFLSENERDFVRKRLEPDQGKAALDRSITMKDVVRVFKDYKVIVAGFAYLGLIVPAYGYAYFSPSIIQTFVNDPVQTQLRSVPPWAAAFVFSMVVAWMSDAARHRYIFIIATICISIAGFAILLTRVNNSVKYGALFLVTCGTYSAMPLIVCVFNMNLGGHHRRSIGSAWQISFGNCGGIIAVYAFLVRDAPLYIPGYAVCIAFACVAALSSTVYAYGCYVANKQRKTTTMVITEFEDRELGDLSPRYRYML